MWYIIILAVSGVVTLTFMSYDKKEQIRVAEYEAINLEVGVVTLAPVLPMCVETNGKKSTQAIEKKLVGMKTPQGIIASVKSVSLKGSNEALASKCLDAVARVEFAK